MAFKVRHEYALGETWQQYWSGRNGGMVMPTSVPESQWARIDDTLGLPAFELRYLREWPNSDQGTIRRNQISRPRASKGSGTLYTPASGETAWWGFRIRFDPATTFGNSFLNLISHTSFGAVDSGPTFIGKTSGASQNLQLIYDRGASVALVAKPTSYWLDVKMEYKTHPTAGYVRVWLKRSDEVAFPSTPAFEALNIDSYGLSNDINQLTWGIYEYETLGEGHYPCNALQRYGIATTAAEIDTFLGAAGLPGRTIAQPDFSTVADGALMPSVENTGRAVFPGLANTSYNIRVGCYVKKVTDPVMGPCLEHFMRAGPGDSGDGGSMRAEVEFGGGAGHNIVPGDDLYFGFATKYQDWGRVSGHQLCMQFKNDGTGSPAMSFDCFSSNNAGDFNVHSNLESYPLSVAANKWVRWVGHFHVTKGPGTGSRVRWWRDDMDGQGWKLVVDDTDWRCDSSANGGGPGGLIMSNKSNAYIKFGQYGAGGHPVDRKLWIAQPILATSFERAAGSSPPPSTGGQRPAPGSPVQVGRAAGSLTLQFPQRPASMVADDFWQVYVENQTVELAVNGNATTYTLTTAEWPTLTDNVAVNVRISYGKPGDYSGWTDPPVPMTPGAVVTPPPEPTPPPIPESMTVTPGDGQVTVTIVPMPEEDRLDGDGMQVYVNDAWWQATTFPFDTVVVTGLPNDVPVAIRASQGGSTLRPNTGNNRYSGWTNPQTVTPTATVVEPTTPPAAPTGFALSGEPYPNGPLFVWQPNAESDLLEYRLYRRAAGTPPYVLVASLAATASPRQLRDANYALGTPYEYVLRAVNTAGQESANSSVVAVTVTRPAPPVDPGGTPAPPVEGWPVPDPARPAVEWTSVITDSAGNELDGIDVLPTYTFERNRPAQATVELDLEEPAAAALYDALANGLPRLKGYRDGVLRFYGEWAPTRDVAAADQATATITFVQADGNLDERPLTGTDTLTFTQVDAGQIAWTLIDEQNAIGPTGLEEGTIEATQLRDRTYEPGKLVGEAVRDLTEVIGGFDYEVEPVDDRGASTLGVWHAYAEQGQDKTSAVNFEYGPDTAGSIEALTREWKRPVNRALFLGAEGLSSLKEDAESQGVYGVHGQVVTDPDVSVQATADSKAEAMLRPDPIRVVQFDPAVDSWRPWDDFWIGDTVGVRADRGALLENGSARVNQIVVTPDPAGGEILRVAVETADTSGRYLRPSSWPRMMRDMRDELARLGRAVTRGA